MSKSEKSEPQTVDRKMVSPLDSWVVRRAKGIVALGILATVTVTCLAIWWPRVFHTGDPIFGSQQQTAVNAATTTVPPVSQRQLDKDREDAKTAGRDIGLKVAGGIAAAFAALMALSRLELTKHERQTAERGQHADRYSKSIELLGNDNADSQLGGLYALEALALSDASYRGTVVEVIAAFVRERARRSERLDDDEPPEQVYAEYSGYDDYEPPPPPNVSIEAALTILGRNSWPRPINLRNTNLASATLPPDADLAGSIFAGADLTGIDFTGVNLTGADLRSATLTHATMRHAILHAADLRYATLKRADCYGTDLTDANLYGATLTTTILTSANLTSADLRRSGLTNANFTDANITDANLYFAFCHRTNFYGATITRANFAGVDRTTANFTDTVGAPKVAPDQADQPTDDDGTF